MAVSWSSMLIVSGAPRSTAVIDDPGESGPPSVAAVSACAGNDGDEHAAGSDQGGCDGRHRRNWSDEQTQRSTSSLRSPRRQPSVSEQPSSRSSTTGSSCSS